MADIVGARVLDIGLAALDSECDKIFVCSAEPTTYAEASATFALGVKTFTAGVAFGAPAAGSPNGRQVTSVPITDGIITATGTVARWAAVDSVNSRLLAQGLVSGSGAVTLGQAFTLDAITVKMPAASAYIGPLDLVSGALFWGGFRAGSAAKAGSPCCRLVRTGGAQADISTLADGSFNSADAFFDGSAYKVVTLYDQSGNGLDFTQATDAKRPIFVLSGIGGKPAMTSDASGEKWLGVLFTVQAQPFSMAMVAKTNNFVPAAYLGDEVGGWSFGTTNTNGGSYKLVGPTELASATSDTAGHSVQAVYNSTSSILRVDATEVTGDASTRSIGALDSMLLMQEFQGGTCINGALGEMSIWPGITSSGNRGLLNTNMNTFWGI